MPPYTLAIDFETANRSSRSICAFGWSVLSEGHVVTSEQVLINPEEDFDAGNIRVLLQDMFDRTNLDHPVELHRFCGVRMGEVAY